MPSESFERAVLSSHDPVMAAIVGCQRHRDQLNLSNFFEGFSEGDSPSMAVLLIPMGGLTVPLGFFG